MKPRNFLLITGLLLFLMPLAANAQEFIYRPVNPAFGGNYLNYQWMLSSAQLQSDFKEEPVSRDLYRRDALEDFQQSLNRQILNQISRQIMATQFGEGVLGEGSYIFGTFEIEVMPGADGLIIYILDNSTGNETTITIPYF
jgi:curli production assembly/transport component CsgF